MSIRETLKKILLPVVNPVTAKINRFEGKHKGETCYLIAGGISLKYFNFKAFDNHVSLVMNQIPFHKDFKKLDARYCFFIEPYWFFPLFKTRIPPIKYIRNRLQERYREIIAENRDKEFFINLSNYPVTSGKNINYIFNHIPNSTLAQYFYDRGINPFIGTARVSVFMAIYFGFSKAYLLGYDYTHYPSRVHHWFEKGDGIAGTHLYHEQEFFKIASEFIELVTVTVDAESQVLPYITYKELTGKDPHYRENVEILSEKNFNAIASCPDYAMR